MDRRDELIRWIWYSGCFSAGSSSASDVLYDFRYDIGAVFDAGKERFSEIDGLKPEIADKLCDKELKEAERVYDFCLENGIGLLTVSDGGYPSSLRRLSDKPVLLYYRGDIGLLDENCLIAVVGTRSMTEYGKRAAYSITYDLARGGAVVVSGMARGIDGIAHRGCLDAGGKTVAVIGCGIDRAYPAEHEALMKEIAESGLVLSEYRPGTPPNGYNFPKRNRIISGLSEATLVVEAPKGSGALITAKTAITQGKRVFALPGKVGEINSTGTNELLKESASTVTDAADILIEFEEKYRSVIDISRIPSMRSKAFQNPVEVKKAAEKAPGFFTKYEGEKKEKPKKQAPEDDPEAKEKKAEAIRMKASKLTGNNRAIFDAITESENGGASADTIITKTGLAVQSVMAGLTFLEVMKLIKANPGGIFTIND